MNEAQTRFNKIDPKLSTQPTLLCTNIGGLYASLYAGNHTCRVIVYPQKS